MTESEQTVRLEMLAGSAGTCGADACSTDEIRAGETGAEEQGGEPACFANLVCPECGAVVTEGHVAGCAAVREA